MLSNSMHFQVAAKFSKLSEILAVQIFSGAICQVMWSWLFSSSPECGNFSELNDEVIR